MQRSKVICTWSVIAVALAFTMSANAYQGMAMPKLHVNGRNLQDTNGNNVLLHGYMQPATSYFNGGSGVNFTDPTTFYPSDVAGELTYFKNVAELMTHTNALFGKSHGWYCSFVRYLDGDAGWSNGSLTDSAMFNRWITNMCVPYVQYCQSVGIYVVICGHPAFVNANDDGSKNMTAQYKTNLINWFTAVAGTSGIKSANNVMFEICNEPVGIESSLGNGQWGWGDAAHNQAFQTYMNDIVNAIRNTGADNVIWVPALGYSTTLSQFASYPISGSNIGYCGHWYPYGDTNMNDFNNSFTNNWKPCTDEYPLIITECTWNQGDSYGLINGTTAGFGNTTKSLFDAQGNVTWVIGMTGDDLGNLSQGWSHVTYPTTSGGQAAFDWWPTYTGSAPSGGGGAVANGTYKLINRNSGKALDATGQGTTNGTQIEQWTYGGGNNQKWTLTSLSTGIYQVIGVQSGKSLDIAASGTANGTKVELWDYNGGNNQKFGFSATSSGYYRITPQNATGSCLDVNGASTADGALVQLWTYGGGNNQQWIPQAP